MSRARIYTIIYAHGPRQAHEATARTVLRLGAVAHGPDIAHLIRSRRARSRGSASLACPHFEAFSSLQALCTSLMLTSLQHRDVRRRNFKIKDVCHRPERTERKQEYRKLKQPAGVDCFGTAEFNAKSQGVVIKTAIHQRLLVTINVKASPKT
jgi:hypothetical protein